MEAVIIKHKFSPALSLGEVAANFFKTRSVEDTDFLFLKFFQCWVLKDCKNKAEIADEEVALFFDQLSELVAAAYQEHQKQKANNPDDEGEAHE